MGGGGGEENSPEDLQQKMDFRELLAAVGEPIKV